MCIDSFHVCKGEGKGFSMSVCVFHIYLPTVPRLSPEPTLNTRITALL